MNVSENQLNSIVWYSQDLTLDVVAVGNTFMIFILFCVLLCLLYVIVDRKSQRKMVSYHNGMFLNYYQFYVAITSQYEKQSLCRCAF